MTRRQRRQLAPAGDDEGDAASRPRTADRGAVEHAAGQEPPAAAETEEPERRGTPTEAGPARGAAPRRDPRAARAADGRVTRATSANEPARSVAARREARSKIFLHSGHTGEPGLGERVTGKTSPHRATTMLPVTALSAILSLRT